MICGSCSTPGIEASTGPCPTCHGPILHHGRFLLLEPLADGSRALDVQEQEGVRLWKARRFVPDGVECVAELWVSNTASEAQVLEAMDPMDDLFEAASLFGPRAPRSLPVSFADEPAVVLEELPETPRRRWWRRLRPMVMAAMVLSLVPLALAANPPPLDYGDEAIVPRGLQDTADQVRNAPGVQRCLASYRDRVRTRSVPFPALLTVQGSPSSSVAATVAGRSSDPELTSCLVMASRGVDFPPGSYHLAVPVGEGAP